VIAAKLALLVLGMSVRILTKNYWSVRLPVVGDPKRQLGRLGGGGTKEFMWESALGFSVGK